MDFVEPYERLLKDPTYVNWEAQNKDFYLAHIMKVVNEKPAWQVGFYNKDIDRIITFDVDEAITIQPSDEVFKEGKIIMPLLLKEVKLGFSEALAVAEELRSGKYSAEMPTKTICLLQNISEGLVWNISFVTQAFTIINVKVDAGSGAVISEIRESLLQWKK